MLPTGLRHQLSTHKLSLGGHVEAQTRRLCYQFYGGDRQGDQQPETGCEHESKNQCRRIPAVLQLTLSQWLNRPRSLHHVSYNAREGWASDYDHLHFFLKFTNNLPHS